MNRCSIKKLLFKNLAIFTGKHLCWSLFFNENAGLQSCNFFKKRLKHRRFPVNNAKFLRALVLINICERQFERFPITFYIIKDDSSE